jgi:hypothetical protein
MRQGAEPLEQPAVALEAGAEHPGNGQDVVPMGNRSHDVVQDEAGARLDILLVAGRAEPAALARKSQQVFVLAMVAADPGEAARQVAAFEELVNDLRDDGPQATEARLVLFGINPLELVVVAVDALP